MGPTRLPARPRRGRSLPFVLAAGLACAAATLAPATCGAIDPEGGVGGGSIAGTLTVTVVDEVTAQPIANAYCQVGAAPGAPFAANIKRTNASGVAAFSSAALVGPQTVTVGKEGYTALTIVGVNARQMILPIGLRGAQASKALYQGEISGFNAVTNDGKFDAAVVLPSLSIEDLTSFANFGQFAPIVVENFPLVGNQPIPGNVYLPLQIEFLFVPVERTPYFAWLPNQTTQDLFTFYGRLPTSSLIDNLGSDNPNLLGLVQDFEMREYGIVEGINVNGPATRNLSLTNNAQLNLRARVANTAPGTDVFVFSAADLDGQSGLGRLVPCGFDGLAGGSPATTLTLATIQAGGAFTGMDYLVGALQSDTAVVALANSFVSDRSGLAPGDTAQVTAFMRPPQIAPAGAFLSWTDIENPGVSPAPDLHFAEITLVKTIPDTNPGSTPEDSLEIGTPQWRFILDANAASLTIPRVGTDIAPIITNPASTADLDRLDWNVTGAALELAPSFNYDAWDLVDRARFGTHVAWNAIRYVTYPETLWTAVPGGAPPPVETLLGEPAPNPFQGSVRVSFDLSSAPGPASLAVYDVSGRRVRALHETSFATGRVEVSWDGADDFGNTVPPGTYFLRLQAGETIAAKRVVKAQ